MVNQARRCNLLLHPVICGRGPPRATPRAICGPGHQHRLGSLWPAVRCKSTERPVFDGDRLPAETRQHSLEALGPVPNTVRSVSAFEGKRELLPSNQFVWESDWPHTQYEQSVTYQNTCNDAKHINGFYDIDCARKLYGTSIG